MKINFVFDDKTKHVFAGIAIALLFSLLIYFFTVTGVLMSGFYGLLIGAFVGAMKELVHDKLLKLGVATWHDFIATLYGSCVGAVLSIMILGFILTH